MSALRFGRRRCAAHRGRVVAVVVTAAVIAVPSSGLAAAGWSGPTSIDGSNPPQNVSCPTATFCAVVGTGGWGQTFNGISWGAPVNIDPSSNPSGHTLTAVSCPSASFCAAVDQAGNAVTFNGTSWSSPVAVDATRNALTAVSCTSASFCVAGDGGGNGFSYDGSTWSGPVVVNHVSNSEDIGGMSCPSSSFCIAVGENGTFETSINGGVTWTTPQTIKSGVNLQAVSCPSTGFCIAVDNAGNAYTYDGSAWSAGAPIDTATAQIDGGEFTAVSCPSASFCVAIDGRENVLTFNGSAWSAPQNLASAVAHPGVACASSSFCAAVDGVGDAFVFGAATAPPPPPPATLPAPVLGKTANATPVSGVVFVRPPRGKSLDIAGHVLAGAAAGGGTGFVRLTAAAQIPVGSEVNSLRGSLKLVTATAKKDKTQSGTFRGGIFKLTQATRGSTRGLATLALVESAFKGAPTYGTCRHKGKATDAAAAAVSSKVLQLLKASAHGKFRTRGRYSAATVRGTIWTVADRCDGTLTHDITDSVSVTDFVRHKTIVLHGGQSYLAKAPGGHK
jgi:hypothetical protein